MSGLFGGKKKKPESPKPAPAPAPEKNAAGAMFGQGAASGSNVLSEGSASRGQFLGY